MEQPVRSVQRTYRCHCLLIDNDSDTRNYCQQATGGPDEPFCESCKTRHQVDPGFRSVTVTEYMTMPKGG